MIMRSKLMSGRKFRFFMKIRIVAFPVLKTFLKFSFSSIQVLLYATALNEVVEEDGIGAKSDGEKIIKRMWNRTITGMSSEYLNEKN